MNQILEYITYPFLFAALYFEVFLVLSFFEQDARRRRKLTTPLTFPSVAIIVPCYNEEKTIAATADSVLALDYPKEKLSVILVDDGSTDRTAEIVETYRNNSQVTIIHKKNGGKYTALNAGIVASTSEFVGCLDADSFVSPGALMLVMANFDHDKIGAVTSSMSVNAPTSILEKMQEAEYLMGVAMRHTLATWNGLYVTPGPFTIYRKKAFDELGLFRPAHNTEDLEIALRLQRGGWKIQNAPAAGVYTNAPKTLKALVKQRVRWTTGFMRNAFDYRDLIGDPSYGVLGVLVLPIAVTFIFAGVGLFGISTFQSLSSVSNFVIRASEVPLSFTFAQSISNWFYVPTSGLLFLSGAMALIGLWLIFAGAAIAKKKTNFGISLLWYVILYTFIAVWWRIRAITDVALGIRRSWR